MREILFVAGETSGDLHAAMVVRALRERGTRFAMSGVGGTRMEREGVALLKHSDELAVMGFVEVLRHVPKHWMLLRRLRARLASGRVALVVVIDYPGFNMKVARAARDAGVPVLYYITPQVWAWGAKRLTALATLITRAACILPFEEPLLREYGIDATFVGHPLLDRAADMSTRAEARRALRLEPDAPLLALFPGSRAQEIARHLDAFVATARVLEARIPGLRVVVSGAPGIDLSATCPYPVVSEASFQVLRAADAAMCKSGTTTLEAAVAGCPHVVAYRTSPITYAIAKRLIRIPHIGLVNVVAGREVAREFVQGALVPEDVAGALAPLLDRDDRRRVAMEGDLAAVRALLGSAGASARVAEMAEELAARGVASTARLPQVVAG